jgi:predicted PurR-regulated permease PerM
VVAKHEPLTVRELLSNAAWIALALAVVVALYILLGPIITPFAFACVLAYLLLPATDWLQRHRIPRTVASAVMVLVCGAVALGLVLIIIPVLEREAVSLNEQLPNLVNQANAFLAPLLKQWLGIRFRLDPAALRTMAFQQVGQQDMVAAVLAKFGSGSLAVLSAVVAMALVPVLLFYLLLDGHQFTRHLDIVIPRRWHAAAMNMWTDVDAVLAQFLRGQITVMLLLAVYYSTTLTLTGVESALPIGIVTGLLIFIPYVGFTLGLVLALMVVVLEAGTWQAIASVLAIYGVGYVLEGFVLTPRLVGERIGLHPLAVIFALLAFGHIFGFFGILLALPASAVLLVALRRVRNRYLASTFYNRT